MTDLIGFVVHQGHATLWELMHIYTLEEAYWIWECDYVPLVNEGLRAQRRAEKARMEAAARKFLR